MTGAVFWTKKKIVRVFNGTFVCIAVVSGACCRFVADMDGDFGINALARDDNRNDL